MRVDEIQILLDQGRIAINQGNYDEALDLLERLRVQAPLRPNPNASPSIWYMALIDGHYFFDGFGFEPYKARTPFQDRAAWKTETSVDKREAAHPPVRPLLPYLEALDRTIPKRYSLGRDEWVENDEWLIFKDDDL